MSNLVKRFGERGRKTLDSWISDALSDTDKTDEDGNIRPIAAMVLVHMVGGAQSKEIHSVRFGKNKSYPASDLAALFRGKAEAYSQELPGVQTFQLLALYQGASEPEAFQPFIVSGSSPDNHGLGSEAPNETGQKQQMMRWNDNILSQAYRHQEHLNAATARIIEVQNVMINNLGARLVELQHENVEAVGIVKDLMVEQATKHQENEMQRLEYERKTKEREQYLKLLPALVNGLTGREIFPIATQDTAIIETIAENMKEEDIMKVAELLPPHISGMLFQRFSSVIEKRMKEKEMRQIEARSRSQINPENEAAGDVS